MQHEQEATPSSWGDEAQKYSPSLFSHKGIWIGMSVVALLVIGGGLIMFRGGSTQDQSITLSLHGADKVARGVPFDLEVAMQNIGQSAVRDAIIRLNLPASVIALNALGQQSMIVNDSLGDIGGGTTAKRVFTLVAVGEVRSVASLEATLSYTKEGKNRFEATEKKELTIKESAIRLEVSAPDHVVLGSQFTVTVNYQNAEDFNFQGVTLQAEYPSAFKFISASFSPDSLNNYWRLGELRKGSKGELQIKGSLEGTSETTVGMPIKLSVRFGSTDYILAESHLSIALAPPPITLTTNVNGRDDYVARVGDRLIYRIHYENKSGIALADAVIKTELMGELFDVGTLSTNGDINLQSRTIIWNASKVPALKTIDPGSSGDVGFEINLLSTFPLKRLSDKNYLVRMRATMESPSVPYYLTASKTTASMLSEIKVAGLISVDAQAFYRDLAAFVVNKGTMPPKVGMPTEYTVHWNVRNYGTDVSQVVLRATLASGVRFVGAVKSTNDVVPLYNENTQEVSWTIPTVLAGRGVVGSPLEAVFKIEATPSANQVGQFQPLMGETILTATDSFTESNLTARDVGLTTALPDDTTIGQDGGKVVQ